MSEANVAEFPSGEEQGSETANVAEAFKIIFRAYERLEEEKSALAEDIRDVYTEAKAAGFESKIMRRIIKLRKMEIEKRREEDELLQPYMAAIGME